MSVDLSLLVNIIPLALGIIKYGHSFLTNRKLKDDYIGHILIIIGIILLSLGIGKGFYLFQVYV